MQNEALNEMISQNIIYNWLHLNKFTNALPNALAYWRGGQKRNHQLAIGNISHNSCDAIAITESPKNYYLTKKKSNLTFESCMEPDLLSR